MERLQCPENSWCRIWRGATWFFTQFWPRCRKPFVGLCCNARSLTGIFTLAQNMGSAVHRWLQSWNMDPSITWTLLLRTWKQKIISNSSVFFAQLTYIVGGVWGLLGLHRRLVDSAGLVEKSQAGAILRGVWGWGGYHSQFIADGRTLRSPANKMWLFEYPIQSEEKQICDKGE